MSLNTRQKALYTHRCNIWSVTRTKDGNGKPGDETYSLSASSVPCYYQYTPNVDDAIPGGGRVKRATIFTTDIVHMEASQTLEDGWILKNVSVKPDGSADSNNGTYHRVLGAANVIPRAGNRQANKRSVMAMVLEHPPVEVTV